MTDYQSIGYNSALNQFNLSADNLEVNNLTVQNITLSSVVPNAVLISNASSQLDDVVLSTNQVLMGTTGAPIGASILGTTNQVVVTNNPTNLTLSLPQSIGITSTPEFATVRLDSLIANQLVHTDASNNLSSFTLAVNGAIPIGSNSPSGPVAATLTAGTNIGIVNAQGSITINNTASSALVAKSLVYTDASNNLASLTLTDGQLAIGSTSAIPVASTLTGTTSQVIVTNGSGTITLSTPQNIASSSTPTFKGLSITTTGISTTSLLASSSLSATNITLTNPTNQIVTGSGTTTTLNFVAPATTAILTFPNSTDTMVAKNTTDTLTNKTLTLPIISSISNTGILTLPISTDTLIGRDTTDTLTNKTMTSPTINSPTISGTITTNLTASLPIKTNASSQLTASAINLASSEVTGVLPVAKLGISNGSGIAISGAGVISTTGAVSTPNITLTDNTNQILMGTTHTLQLTAPVASQAGNITVTMPTVTSTLATLDGTETFTNKSFWGNSMFSGTGTVYQTGTASRSGSTITGSGTTFTQAMAGGVLRFSTSGEICFITGFTNATSITSNISGTVANQAYAIRYNVFCTDTAGTRMGLPPTMYTNGFALSCPPLVANDTLVVTNLSQLIKNKNFDSSNVFSLNTDNTRTVTIVPLNANSTNQNLWFTSSSSRTYFFNDAGTTNSNVIVSEGNQTINGIKTFGTSIALATSGGTAAALDYYEVGASSTVNASGPWVSQSITFKFDRIGHTVCVSWSFVQVAATASTTVITISSAFVARFRPTATTTVAVPVYQNGVIEPGLFTLFTDGTSNFQTCNTFGNFTGSCGITAGTATYRV
jgi:hypothetical protein